MADRPIDEIRQALSRIHKVAIGESTDSYMSIPADPKRDADLILSAAIDELAALRLTRDQAERDLKFWAATIAEVGSLKRRITELRRDLAGLGQFHGSVLGKHARLALQDDDARRRRFEAERARRRVELAAPGAGVVDRG